MKSKALLTLLTLSSAVVAQAQPSITAANYHPAPGQTFSYKSLNNVTAPGSSGANVTWNFSSLNGTNTLAYNNADCAGSPECAAYPGASFYIANSGLGSKTFYILDASGMQQNGLQTASSTSIYSNPQRTLVFPLAYQGTFTDDYAMMSTAPGATLNSTGIVNGVADGYGTLITPTGTYANVLRVKSVLQQTDVLTGPTPVTVNSTIEIYSWYQAGLNHEVMNITTATVNGNSGTTTSYTTALPNNTSSINSALAAIESTVHIYPNPASDQFEVAFGSGKINTISVADLMGKVIALQYVDKNSKAVAVFDTRLWTKGIYFISVKTTEGVISKKIVIR